MAQYFSAEQNSLLHTTWISGWAVGLAGVDGAAVEAALTGWTVWGRWGCSGAGLSVTEAATG